MGEHLRTDLHFHQTFDYNLSMSKTKRDQSMWKMTPEQLESWMRIRSNKINSKKRYNRKDTSWKKEL